MFLVTVCLAADIYAENQDDANLIDKLFEQEVDIYNLGKAGKSLKIKSFKETKTIFMFLMCTKILKV